MTETIEAPAALRQINHWIGGRPVAGESGRKGPVFNPATGRQTGEVDFATVEEVGRAVQAGSEAFTTWREVSLAKRAEIFFRIRELVHERREEVARILVSEHGKVLSDALGEVDARARGDRVLLRPPDAAEERVLGAGLDRHRRVLDPAAARRRGGHHAVQLPGHGPDVDVGAGDRVRQRVRAEALREGSVRVELDRGAAEGSRASRTASSTSCTATRSPSTR